MFMFKSIDDFKEEWLQESANTGKLLAALTDESLNQPVTGDHRTLGRLAWHITQTLPEMGGKTGLEIEGPGEKEPVPVLAEDIRQAYALASASLLERVTTDWTDDVLIQEKEMYGQKWCQGQSLYILLKHEIHHRAQMTVLMRQAGLTVPGVYGPSKEEWGQYNAEPPMI